MSERAHGHHHHHRGDDFDWEGMADSLELDAAVMAPLFELLAADVEWSGVRRVLDIGCGPGAIACALARAAPGAVVVALDSSEPLLARVRDRVAVDGLDGRVITLHGDLDHGLTGIDAVDVVWASMVMHHAADLAAAVAAVHGVLAPGGSLVMVEFGEPVVLLSPGDPVVSSGAWSRYQHAANDALRARLPHDPDAIEWPALLQQAGFVGVHLRSLWIEHPAPLPDVARQWLAKHLRRGLDSAADRLEADDVAVISRLLDGVPHRDDLHLRANRQVLIGRRPG